VRLARLPPLFSWARLLIRGIIFLRRTESKWKRNIFHYQWACVMKKLVMIYFVALTRPSRFTILAVHREANALALRALSPAYQRATILICGNETSLSSSNCKFPSISLKNNDLIGVRCLYVYRCLKLETLILQKNSKIYNNGNFKIRRRLYAQFFF